MILGSLALAIACHAQPLAFYVSPTGNDAWSGKLPAANAARTDGPFATLPGARAAVRALVQAGLTQPVTVTVREGTYVLAEPFTLTARDAGRDSCQVSWQSESPGAARLVGGRPVTGWQRQPDGTLVTSLADQGFTSFRFHQLFFRGERQTLARHPNLDRQHPHTGGLLYVDAPSNPERTAFCYDRGEIPFEAWGDWRQAEVNLFPYNCWDHNLIPIAQVTPETREVRLRYPVAGRINEANRYFVQNVLGALDAPGEWFVDHSTGKLYLRPPGGEVADGDVIVPVVENLLLLSGTPDDPVHHVNVRGFHLAYAEQDAIVLEGAEDCQVAGNTITQVGGVGVNVGYLRNAAKGIGNRWYQGGRARIAVHSGDRSLLSSHPCASCRVAGNDISAIGGDGIALVGAGNVADNNHVYQTGLYDMVCAGVTVIGSDNLVSHNEIHDVPRDGIFINGARNTAEYNVIRNSMLYTADNSGIALRQHNVDQAVKDRGNILRFNKILDTVGYGSYPHCGHPPEGFGSPFCAWGIYLDGSICGVTVYGNIIARSAANSIFIQFGGGNVVENNILVETLPEVIAYDCMLFFGYFMYADPQGRFDEPPNDIRHNILYYTRPEKKLYITSTWGRPEWNPRQAVFDENLIWHDGHPIQVELDNQRRYASLADWQAAGFDQRSVVADPGFIDAAHDDFRLKPGSPAYAVGFRDINAEIGKIGAYESPERASWPLANLRLEREDPVVFRYTKPPKPIIDGFELTPVGGAPGGMTVAAEGAASAVVTSETARTGAHSLQFSDAPNDEQPWTPHVYRQLRYPEGQTHFSVDVLNSAEAPADWYMEFRDWSGTLFAGPTFAGRRDGALTAGGKFGAGGRELTRLPNGTWFTVTVDFATGPGAPKTFTLGVTPEGQPEQVFADLPFPDAGYATTTWFGISSTSRERTIFHVDNLILGPADSEALAEAQSAPAIRGLPAREPPGEMRNAEQLALHWAFDEPDGYELLDSSGNGLRGDLGGVARATGAFGRALYLDGGGARAEVEDAPVLHFGRDAFTVTCRLCPTQLGIDSPHQRRRLLDKGLYPQTWWNVDVWSDGRVQMEMVDADGQNGTTVSDGALREGEWTHLAIVVDRQALVTRYYLSGLPAGEKPLPPNFTGSLDLAGKSLTTGIWQPFVGLLDDLRVYRRALSADEIRAQHEASAARYTSTQFTAEEY